MRQLPLQVRLPAFAVFDSFAPGPNGEVLAALRAPTTMPIWVWGPTGYGKTHLLQAVCAAAGAGAGYVPMRGAQLPPEALQGFERLKTVCIDDVDLNAGERTWEQAFFRLFNAAAESGTRLIFAASAAPRQIDWTLEDWRSRAASCVVYQLRELDDAGRREALIRRAAQRGLQLPPETAEYLVTRLPRDLPTLCKILDELDEASLVAQRRLTVPFIRAALEKHVETK
jgi:DnaA family protein